MATQKHEVEISADPRYSDSEIEELAREFQSAFQVHTNKYERFGLPQYPLILVITFGPIAKGFLEGIGRDIWEKIKKKLASTVSNRKEVTEVEFHYSYGPKNIELMVRSSDGNVVASAFDRIQNTLELVEASKAETIYLEFDSKLNIWVPVKEQTSSQQEIALRFDRAVVATLDSVKVRGFTYQMKEELLKQAAKTFAGHPLKYEHSGPPIGKVEKAWYEDGKLLASGVVFKPTNDKERAIVDALSKGDLKGLSMGFSFESKHQ